MATRKQIGWTVPGFGLPLRWPQMQSVRWQPLFQPDENTLLLSALDASEYPKFCYTVRERTMLALINELTDMANWERKIFDTDLTFKWKGALVMSGRDVTRSMADWCVEEVKYYVQNYLTSSIIPAIDGGVIKSDDRIPFFVHESLQKTIASLSKDKRKGSGSNRVVDIVDPYLFAFAFEKTKTLRRGVMGLSECIRRSGEGELARMPSKDDCAETDPAKYPNDMAWSRRFQYLPFDVKFSNKAAGSCRITSYINDVNPATHLSLYCVLENFIETTIPMFNQTLIDLKAPGYQNQRFHVAELGRVPEIVKEPGAFRPPEQRSTQQNLDSHGCYRDDIFVDLKKEFWNIGLQFVLKVTHIELNPETPSYEGEDWHIEGQMNERICATAIYVTSSHNISPSPYLSFRRRIWAEEATLAKDLIQTPPWAPEIYGARSGDSTIQHMGDISLPERRLVTYPNTFPTKLLPFQLDDKSKSGHFTYITLHLIDPNRRAMSSAMVPVQRRDWWASEMRMSCAPLWRLPREVFDRIIELVDGYPLSLDEGYEIRKEFKEEREMFRKKHTKAMEDYLTWDLDWEDDWVQV